MTNSLMRKVEYCNPPSYRTVESYRGYLQRIFHNSCAYCTTTEAESPGSTFNIDHFRPKTLFPSLRTKCENLRYSCPCCNLYKRDRWISEESGCSRHCETCTTHVCNTNISRIIDIRIEDPSDCFFEEGDYIRAYDKSNVAKYTIESLRLNRKQLVRLRHIRRFMSNWLSELQSLYVDSSAKLSEIGKMKQDFSNSTNNRNAKMPDTEPYINLAKTTLDLLELYQEQTVLMIQAEIDRLSNLQILLTGNDVKS